MDIAEGAIGQARAQAAAEDVAPWFVVGDVLRPAELELPARRWATVLDCALFHVFDAAGRAACVRSLAGLLEPGGHVVVLAMSTDGPHFGPEVDDEVVRAAFAEPEWSVEELLTSAFRGRISHEGRPAPPACGSATRSTCRPGSRASAACDAGQSLLTTDFSAAATAEGDVAAARWCDSTRSTGQPSSSARAAASS